MVLRGERRGKFSSPHLVNIFGTKNLNKWGGIIWIGSSYNFSYILVLFGWKIGGIILQGHFSTGPNLENWVKKILDPF
jgi:hypothetical protein